MPKHTAGFLLQSIRIHVRSNAGGALRWLSQARRGENEARRLALDVSYGCTGRGARIAGCAARVYELGPEPAPDDIDGRSPSVVTWHDAEMFYLIASDQMASDVLVKIAISLYARRAGAS